MIFSKGRRDSARHARGRSAAEPAEDPSVVPDRGPYDVEVAPSGVERLDLGSLHIPAVADVEVRVQADQEGSIQQVVLVHGENALQLGAFAAPRSEGVWDEVREELRTSLQGQGAVTQEVAGEYGVELRASVRTEDGPVELRFLGIDGPRWMVRAVYQGQVAVDPATAGPLAEVLDNLVVDRGQEPRPVLEALPLRLPREVAEQAQRDREAAVAPGRPAPIDGVVSNQQHPHRAEPSPGPRRTG